MFKYYFDCMNSYFAEVNRFLAKIFFDLFLLYFSRFALMALVPDSRVSFQKKLRMLRTNREIVIKALRLDQGIEYVSSEKQKQMLRRDIGVQRAHCNIHAYYGQTDTSFIEVVSCLEVGVAQKNENRIDFTTTNLIKHCLVIHD